MKTLKIVALRPQTYGTRQLKAGDEFEAPRLEALVMISKKRAGFPPKVSSKRQPPSQPEPAKVEEKTEAAAETTTENNIDSLRAEAARLGLVVDGRWGVARLQHEIARFKR